MKKRKKIKIQPIEPGHENECVIYVRVSSKEQHEKGNSLEAQEDLLTEYALKQRLAVVKKFRDIESAKDEGRTDFGNMVNFLRTSSCRILLVEKTDRLSRNLWDMAHLDELIKTLQLDIRFVKENSTFTNKARSMEKFIFGLKGLMAKNYVDNLGEEAQKGLNKKAEKGIWPSQSPLGYLNAKGPDGSKIIIPDPERAPIIKMIFDKYSKGGYSVKEIGKVAKEAGLTFRRTGRPIPTSGIHYLLKTLTYTGSFKYNGTIYPGTHEPIISLELFNQVQSVLNERNQNKTRKFKHDFAFTSILSCGICGCSMVGEIKKKRFIYYRCTGSKGNCPGKKYVRQEIFEQKFEEQLQAIAIDQNDFFWIVNTLKQSHEDEVRFRDQAISNLEKEHKVLQRRLDLMYVDKLDGKISDQEYEERASNWKDEQRKVTQSITNHRSSEKRYLASGIQVLGLASQAVSLYQKQTNPLEKRKLLRLVFSKASWKDNGLLVEFRQPFDVLVLSNREKTSNDNKNLGSDPKTNKWLGD